MSSNSLQFDPLTPRIGAEVHGIDLTQPLSDTTFEALWDIPNPEHFRFEWVNRFRSAIETWLQISLDLTFRLDSLPPGQALIRVTGLASGIARARERITGLASQVEEVMPVVPASSEEIVVVTPASVVIALLAGVAPASVTVPLP